MLICLQMCNCWVVTAPRCEHCLRKWSRSSRLCKWQYANLLIYSTPVQYFASKKGTLLLATIVPSGRSQVIKTVYHHQTMNSTQTKSYSITVWSHHWPLLTVFVNIFSAVLNWYWNKFVVRHWGILILMLIIQWALKEWYIIQRTFSIKYRLNLEEYWSTCEAMKLCCFTWYDSRTLLMLDDLTFIYNNF